MNVMVLMLGGLSICSTSSRKENMTFGSVFENREEKKANKLLKAVLDPEYIGETLKDTLLKFGVIETHEQWLKRDKFHEMMSHPPSQCMIDIAHAIIEELPLAQFYAKKYLKQLSKIFEKRVTPENLATFLKDNLKITNFFTKDFIKYDGSVILKFDNVNYIKEFTSNHPNICDGHTNFYSIPMSHRARSLYNLLYKSLSSLAEETQTPAQVEYEESIKRQNLIDKQLRDTLKLKTSPYKLTEIENKLRNEKNANKISELKNLQKQYYANKQALANIYSQWDENGLPKLI